MHWDGWVGIIPVFLVQVASSNSRSKTDMQNQTTPLQDHGDMPGPQSQLLEGHLLAGLELGAKTVH